jgi:hypothetical protein
MGLAPSSLHWPVYRNVRRTLTLLISRKKPLIFLCTEACPQYPLGDQEKGPTEGSLNYNTILQLDLFCKRKEMWTEVPCIQLFFYLWDHPECLHNCCLDTLTLAILCRSQDKHREGGPENPLTMTRSPFLLLHPLPYLLSHPSIWDLLMDVSPFKRQLVDSWGYIQKTVTPEAPAHPCLLRHYSQ